MHQINTKIRLLITVCRGKQGETEGFANGGQREKDTKKIDPFNAQASEYIQIFYIERSEDNL